MSPPSMIRRLRTSFHTHQPELILVFILLVAAGVRLWSIRFALPQVYHPDEDLLVMPAMNILKTGDFNPTGLEYGSLFIYLLSFIHILVYLWSVRNGYLNSVDQLQIMGRNDYPAVFPHPEYVLAGRLLSVLFGVAVVILVYMLATRLGNHRQGLLAAAIAAVTPDLVVHSHYATTDMALVTMCTLALYLLVRAYDNWDSDNAWAYLGAGFVCGLAASTKYIGAVLIVPLLLTPLLKARRLDDLLSLRVIGGPLAMGAGFLAGTPYALLDLTKFTHFLGYNLRVYNRPGYIAQGTTWLWQLNYLFTDRNAALAFPAVAGLFFSFRHWGLRGWIVNSFAFTILLYAFSTSVRETRTWLPVAPIAAIWAALALDLLWQWIRRRLPGPAERTAAFSLIVILILLPLAVRTVEANRNLAGPDVRSLVAAWIEANTTPGAVVAVDRFPPNLDPGERPVERIFGHYLENLDWYEGRNAGYLIASDVIHNNDRLSAEDMARFEALTGRLCLVQAITGPFLAANDRTYWIYQFPPC
jgi:asparagine N-glycosylation enzyme membrane subunit Stt3